MAIPICPYFNICGSCTLQDIDYPIQLENKRKLLSETLEYDDIKVFSGKPYYYRNRMDMIFHSGGLGFRERGKWWKIVDIEKCAISNDNLNLRIAEIRAYFRDADYFDVKKKTGTFRYAVIRTPGEDSSIAFVLNEDSDRLKQGIQKVLEFSLATSTNNIITALVNKNTDVSVSDNFSIVKGSGMLKAKLLGREFLFSAQGFFQNNDEMVDKMHLYCRDIFKTYDTKGTHLLDFYGGAGTFGINNAGLFEGVTIVDNSGLSIEAAVRNIELNGIKNAKAVLLADKHISEIQLPERLFVVTDPARSGMHPKAIKYLNETKPAVIIYVSCNPRQLKLDLMKLGEYKIKSAALFDFFPQTGHLESVVELI